MFSNECKPPDRDSCRGYDFKEMKQIGVKTAVVQALVAPPQFRKVRDKCDKATEEDADIQI